MTVIEYLNKFFSLFFDIILLPFRGWSPFWGLVFISFLAGLLILWIFGKISNQQTIRKIRDRIRGNLLGVRLYQHDLNVVMRFQGQIFRDTGSYLRYSLVPMMVIVVPLILILAQINLNFASQPLRPNEASLVKVYLDNPTDDDILELKTPTGIDLETPPVRIPSEGEIVWRIRPREEGRYTLNFRLKEQTLQKDVYVGDGWRALPNLRSSSWLDLVLYPGDPPLDSASGVKSIEVRYPARELSIFGWNIHWLILFFCFSMVSAFSFRSALGVEI